MLEEIKQFFIAITDWLLLMLIFTVFFFSFNIETVTLFGRILDLPVPSTPSFSAELFTMMVSDVVPSGIPLLVTGPMVAFIAQIKISFFLAFIFTSPFLLIRTIAYIRPALYKREQSLIYKVVTPTILLLGAGMSFAYIFIVPETFRVLYTFTEPIGVTAYLGVNEFVGLTLALLLVTGISFVLPVLMVLLTAFGAVSSQFWWQKFRYAIVLLLIGSAIITPDGSGVSMILMTLPVSALYSVGAFVSGRVEKASEHTHYAVNN